MKTVKVNTKNIVSVIDIPWTLDGFYQGIGEGCTCIETVKTDLMRKLLKNDELIMLVDESGLIKQLELNDAASLLYGYMTHGYPIAGNVLFAEMGYEDFFPPKDPEGLKDMLMETFRFLCEEDTNGSNSND